MTLLTIYVPATDDLNTILPGSATDDLNTILPGSAIVGDLDVPLGGDSSGDPCPDDRRVRIDYEGGMFGQIGFEQFENRVLHAAGRHVWGEGRGYPTRARMVVPRSSLRAVGTYDAGGWRIVEITDPQSLDSWIARYGERA